ncbi:hypothetical protein SAMN02910298_00703 [Pseudobutyrivibrio sp. YE44]|uniref:hypothetical protein n=1 Tax=Pseudobutyrivibrio sp. YE44 TaxID=1520802 RepID=UPI0008892260|nr:hypothetical protein [Pseudobutyrivibrio sp. YE44]SDB13495.1 hypothetical protein SAMN02910298_00703 [Pseudobutyrivibrio sp. YE44]
MDINATHLNLNNKTVISSRTGADGDNSPIHAKKNNQEAYSVSLSREGAEKSKNVPNNNLNKDSEAYRDYVFRMDEILGKLAEGESVSKKDQQWFDSEVQNFASGSYDNIESFGFERADLLNKYIQDREAKEREYNRLTEQLEADKAIHDGRLYSHLKKEHDLDDKEELVKVLTESLEEKENFQTKKDERERKVDESYYKEGFVSRYIEKEMEKVEESLGRDLKNQIKLGQRDEKY